MLKVTDKLAIYMEGALGHPSGKMGYGVLRYSQNPVVAVIDSQRTQDDIKRFAPCERDCPIVDSLESAKVLGAQVLIIGIAPSGGLIPEAWYASIDHAVRLGFSIVNGLHTHLAGRYARLGSEQWIWDVRKEPLDIGVGTGQAKKLANKRVLFVGSDMAVGKMTAALELQKVALKAGIKAEFIATGQIGITIAGRGVALDAVRLDYACGAIERAVMRVQEAELIIIEGQGSLVHPGSTANLPLLRGSCPTHLVFCHRAYQKKLVSVPDFDIPPVLTMIKLYEDLAYACGNFARPQTIGICLNTAHLDSSAAAKAIEELESESGLCTLDVVRQGAMRLLENL